MDNAAVELVIKSLEAVLTEEENRTNASIKVLKKQTTALKITRNNELVHHFNGDRERIRTWIKSQEDKAQERIARRHELTGEGTNGTAPR